ncbi:MAG: hypothetical protein RSF40_01300 [Oscillospiraceae bacterium]
MFKELKRYECPYCKKEHKTESFVLKCLEEHELIYEVEILKFSHDCWGNSETYWEATDILFKDYAKAYDYIKNNDALRLKFINITHYKERTNEN